MPIRAFARLVSVAALVASGACRPAFAQEELRAGPGSRRPLSGVGAFCAEPDPAGGAAVGAGAECPWHERVAAMQSLRRSGVVDIWLRNGVRVRYREMHEPRGQVVVTVGVVGGELLEDDRTRGISAAASTAFDGPSVRGVPAETIEALRKNRDIRLEGGPLPDGFSIRLTASVEDLDAGMKLLSMALSRPLVTPDALAAANEAGEKEFAEQMRLEKSIVSTCLVETIFPPGDARLQPLRPAVVKRHAAADAQAWLERHLGGGGGGAAPEPMEVSIVGDVPLDKAVRLAALAFGSLPDRPRVEPGFHAELRRVPRPVGPLFREFVRDLPAARDGAPRAKVVVGFFGTDGGNADDLRLLRVVARALRARMTTGLDDAGAGDNVDVSVVPAMAYPGFGIVHATASVRPEKAEEARRVMGRALAEAAANGFRADEIRPITDGLVETFDSYNRDPRYWSALLAWSTVRGTDVERAAEGREFYASITAEAATAALRKYCRDEARIEMIVRPAPEGAVAGEPRGEAPGPDHRAEPDHRVVPAVGGP